jgi:hypothetical protein
LRGLVGGLGNNINLYQRCLEACIEHANASGCLLIGELHSSLDLFGGFLLLGFLQCGHGFFIGLGSLLLQFLLRLNDLGADIIPNNGPEGLILR